ncbi:MAG: P27 family phage terminase small subunit [Planctomycetota bacterium]
MAKAKTQSDLEYSRLTTAEKKTWRELRDVLPVEWSDCYAVQLARLCRMIAEEKQLVATIKKTSDVANGMMYGQRGELRRHPLATQLNNTRAQIIALSVVFGLDPKSNAKLSKGGEDGPSLGDLMGGGNAGK